jgi:transposase
MNACVRCICSARGSSGAHREPALEHRCGPHRRWRSARSPGAVCLWCARLAVRWSALPAQSGPTQTTGGGARRCQGPPVRTERSEPRSGGLDCRRAAKLAVTSVSDAPCSGPCQRITSVRSGRDERVRVSDQARAQVDRVSRGGSVASEWTAAVDLDLAPVWPQFTRFVGGRGAAAKPRCAVMADDAMTAEGPARRSGCVDSKPAVPRDSGVRGDRRCGGLAGGVGVPGTCPRHPGGRL